MYIYIYIYKILYVQLLYNYYTINLYIQYIVYTIIMEYNNVY
jgi:hypothetical protein